jgi:hypothetical protein
MFEDICLVCGKPLQDAGYACLSSPCFQCQSFYYSRAYCSDDCQTYDISSPSVSSPSSTRSSPNIGCAYGDEVPPLVPSALGSALKSYMAFNRYNISSSSASSASRSFTDDEDEYHFGSGSSDHDVSDGIYDGNSKSVTIPSGLSYARRPSGTNNSSTVPHPHRRISSDSSFGPVQNIPRSAPIYAHDDNYFDIASLPEDAVDADDSDLLSDQDWYRVKSKYQATKTSKRSRNRASLPACFSLLQTTSSKDVGSSPVLSSSSGNTIARLSPPTPTPAFNNLLSQAQYPPAVNSTPRGRHRDPVISRGARRTVDSSASGSRSGIRPLVIDESSRLYSHTDLKGSTEKLVDWSSVPGFPHRGRATLRRNSSPLQKMAVDVEDPALVLGAAVKIRQEDSGSQSHARTRGRARVEDFGRDSHSTDAPGFGYGRSGLLHRERGSGVQSMRFLPC